LEANDFTVLHKEWTVQVAMSEIEADEPTRVAENETAVANGSVVIGVELQSNRARVVAPDIEGQVLYVVVIPVC